MGRVWLLSGREDTSYGKSEECAQGAGTFVLLPECRPWKEFSEAGTTES
jgi:hypothetical protein